MVSGRSVLTKTSDHVTYRDWTAFISLKVTQHAAKWSNGSKYSKLKKTIEIQLVRLTEVCGKVLSEKNG